MRLSKTTHDQLEVLLFISDRAPACVPVIDISAGLGLTLTNALKLVTRLVRTRLVRAKRGPGGGVMLAKPASTIRLGETISLLEDINTLGVSEIGARRSTPSNRSSRFLSDAFTEFVALLDSFTLADLGNGRSSIGSTTPDEEGGALDTGLPSATPTSPSRTSKPPRRADGRTRGLMITPQHQSLAPCDDDRSSPALTDTSPRHHRC